MYLKIALKSSKELKLLIFNRSKVENRTISPNNVDNFFKESA